MELLAQLEALMLTALDSPWMLAIVLAACIADAIFPPVPSETVLVAAAAFAASTGELGAVAAIALVAAAGAWIGDNAVFRLGRAVGTDRWRWMRASRTTTAIDAARRGLKRRGTLVILTGRLIPMGRVAVNLAAGATGFPARRFALTSAGAVTLWAAYSVGIGVWFGQWLGHSPLLAAALGVVVAIVLGLVIDRILRRFDVGGATVPIREVEPLPARRG
ncbi:DedA family protein [Agrococcus baldri]|uniref:VTT domain-containing protein n=1 Tax=Agrococcus baldri TaxID=153730 RepID=A0AA87URW6_9MICO|nr:VTT domain-containing protein [Agrococcus baldri]GEK80338.1 hypothetical protein ABA31_16890 [Agrococcus baldri]